MTATVLRLALNLMKRPEDARRRLPKKLS